MSEFSKISENLQKEFTKNEKIGFLSVYKKLNSKINSQNKKIKKIKNEIKLFEEINFLGKFDFVKEKKNISNLIIDKKEIEKTPITKQNASYYSPSVQNFYPLYNKSKKPNKRNNKSILKKSEKRKIKLNQDFPISFQHAAKLTKNPYRKKIPRSLQFTGIEKFKNKSKTKKKSDIKSNFELSVLKSEKMSLRTTTNNNFNQNITQNKNHEINLEGIKKMKQIIAKNQERKWIKDKKKKIFK